MKEETAILDLTPFKRGKGLFDVEGLDEFQEVFGLEAEELCGGGAISLGPGKGLHDQLLSGGIEPLTVSQRIKRSPGLPPQRSFRAGPQGLCAVLRPTQRPVR